MKVSDFCKTAAGGTPLKSNKVFYEGGNIPWLLSGEVGNKNITATKNFITQAGLEGSSAKIFPENTVLIAMYGATAGEVGILRCDASTNQAVCGIYPNERVLPEYLYYFFLNHKEVLVAQAVGNAQPNISQQKIKDTDIDLPSIPEQKRIVAILDQAFADIDKARALTEQNLKNARELFESYLQQVCSERGDGWKACLVGDVCDLFQGLAINQKTKHLLVKKSSLPLLRIKDLRSGTVEQYVAEQGFPEKARVVEEDIIYTRTGQIGLVFRGFEGVLHNNAFKVVPNEEISREYFYWWLQHSQFKDVVIGLASRAAQPDITHALFKKQEIVVPPLEYQFGSVKLLEELKVETVKLHEIYLAKLNKLESLKKALLQKAFSGELTKYSEEAAA